MPTRMALIDRAIQMVQELNQFLDSLKERGIYADVQAHLMPGDFSPRAELSFRFVDALKSEKL